MQIETPWLSVPDKWGVYNCCSFFRSGYCFHLLHGQNIYSIAAPSNPQNDRVYVSHSVSKKHVPPAVAHGFSGNYGCIELIFVDPGSKINHPYYRDMVLTQCLLLTLYHISGEMFIFLQDSAPAHWARKIIELQSGATLDWWVWDPAKLAGSILNPVDYFIWSGMERRVYQERIQNTDELRQRLEPPEKIWSSTLLTLLLISSDVGWQHGVCAKEGHFKHNLKKELTQLIDSSLLFSNKILWQLNSKCAVYVVLFLSGSVETQLQVSRKFCNSAEYSFLFALMYKKCKNPFRNIGVMVQNVNKVACFVARSVYSCHSRSMGMLSLETFQS